MKSFHIIMLLLLVSVSISLFIQIGIWPSYASTYGIQPTGIVISIIEGLFGGAIIGGLIGTVASRLFNSENAAGYGMFSGFFVGIWTYVLGIVSNLETAIGVNYISSILTIVAGVMFLVGLIQIRSGGWEVSL